MIELLDNLSIIIPIFVFGMLVAFALFIEQVRRFKARRFLGELRRARRAHQAELAREKAAAAAEIAAIREQLRHQANEPKPFDAIDACKLNRPRLMNREEYRLFQLVKRIAGNMDGNICVFPQVPLGEVLSVAPSAGSEAQRRRTSQELQCKRVDIAITNAVGQILVGIEYQGGGHYQGTASWRDQIKRSLFRKAEIPLLEVHPGQEHLLEGRLADILRNSTTPYRDKNALPYPKAVAPKSLQGSRPGAPYPSSISSA